MEQLPLLALLCFGCGLAAAQDQCATVHQNPSPNKMALPMLPTTAFKAVVRAQILNKNMTVEAVEYADESVNSATLVMMQNGEKATIIMSYATNEVFYVVPSPSSGLDTAGPMTCYTSNLTTDDNTQLFGMSAGSSATGSQQHLFSTNKILNFINGTEVYKGQVNIGGIPANRFSSCVYWPQLNANFTLEYYFTLPGWQTPSGLDQIPIRAEITGISHNKTGSTSIFHHIYEYVNFEPYVNDPETIFETPPGVYCLLRKPTRKPPMINNHFYYREEISNPGNDDGDFPMISESDIWYDYDLQLVRFDVRTVPAGVSADFSMSSGPFRVIHDYGVGVQYTIAVDMNECSVDPIPIDSKGFDAVYNITRQTLGMRKPMQFFNLNDTSYLYAGQRLARGQQCDVFQAVLTNIPGHGIVVYEVYFLSGADDITDRGSDSVDNSIKAIPMRIMMWETGTLAQQYEIHDFDQDSAQANAFDVTPCFPGQSSIDFEIALKVKDTNLMPQLAPYVGQLMQLQVSINAGITPVRVQRTRLHWTNYKVYFEGTLLGAAPSLAKYEISPTSAMSGVASKALQNIADAMTCAQQCDNLEEWNCVQFDYCGTSRVCTLAKVSNPATLTNTSQCDHYQRVLGGGFDQQAQLDQVWTNLKNRVYGGQLVISLPLPDSSGKVDLSIDTTTLDDTKKIILTANTITNQVVSNVNRDGTSTDIMSQFQTIPQKAGKGYNTMLQGLSVDDCASNCVGEETYNCQSFHYCWEAGSCFLSSLHPDERPNMLKDNPNCDLYIRDYTSNFDKFDGQTVLSASNTIYQNVMSASECAKLCTYYNTFHCESFDFCTDVNTCFLGQTHYYDAPKANIKQAPSCAHYSRAYLQDFVAKSHKQVPLRDNRVIQDVNPQQCAKLCVEEGSFTCSSFDYCGNYSECRLSDASVSNTGQVTLESSAYCDVYSRQYSSGQTAAQTSDGGSSSSGGYSKGAMAGLGFAMIVVGIILGLVALVVYDKFIAKRGGGDGMAISFSKQENSES